MRKCKTRNQFDPFLGKNFKIIFIDLGEEESYKAGRDLQIVLS